jgi:hypothetical protein
MILWHNVAEITYKYIAKLYEMYFLFLMILEYFCWFNPLNTKLNPTAICWHY